MKVCILMGSPRLNENTAELCKPFVKALESNGSEVHYITLVDKLILPCKGCYECQQVSAEYGCPQKDDMQRIVDNVIWADLVVLATPIYTWYCPSEMKAMLDRCYGMSKFYGKGTGSLWNDKKVALLLTHGYKRKYATEPFVIGIKRFCKHYKLQYNGMYSVRDKNNIESFQTKSAIVGAKKFAIKLSSR